VRYWTWGGFSMSMQIRTRLPSGSAKGMEGGAQGGGVAGASGAAAARDRHVGERRERDPTSLELGDDAAAVLAGVPHPALREHVGQRRAGRRRAALMVHERAGLEANVVAAVARAPAEILVLAVHEEPFVPAAELLEHRSPNEQAGSRGPIWAARALVV